MRLRICLSAALFCYAMAGHAATLKLACSVLSQQAATTLYGTVGTPHGFGGSVMTNCAYEGGDGGTVVLSMMAVPEHGYPGQMFDMLVKKPGAKLTPLAGLGERAVVVTDPSSPKSTVLMVLSGLTILTPGLDRADSVAVRPALQHTMQDILAHI